MTTKSRGARLADDIAAGMKRLTESGKVQLPPSPQTSTPDQEPPGAREKLRKAVARLHTFKN